MRFGDVVPVLHFSRATGLGPGRATVLFIILHALQSAIMTAYQKGSRLIHYRRDERYAPHLLYMCSAYVLICDVHAIMIRSGMGGKRHR